MGATVERPLTPAEAGERLGIPKKTLEEWRRRGMGPRFARYPNRRVRYFESDLEAWRTAQMVETDSSVKAKR